MVVSMTRTPASTWAAPLVAACLAAAPGGLRGEDDTVVELAAPVAATVNQVDLEQQLAAMLFQPTNDPVSTRRRVEERLAIEVSALDQVVGLTADQRRKCETAAALDVARLFEQVEALQERYAGRTVDLQQPAGQAEWQQFYPEVQALQTRLRDADGDDKLLARLIPGILVNEQLSAWRHEVAERRRWQWGGVIDVGMAQLDVALGLTTAQHDAIRDLLVEKPLRISPSRLRMHGGHFIPFVCRHALSRVDQQRLRKLVNDRQWATLKNFIEQGRGMADHLLQQKVILE